MVFGREHLLFLLGLGLSAGLASAFSIVQPNTINKKRTSSPAPLSMNVIDDDGAGKLEELKKSELELSALLAEVRAEKLEAIEARPLKIGIVGFGRFGQFMADRFAKHGEIVATSRSDYGAEASEIGVKFIPWDQPEAFFAESLDVIVVAVSITSFKNTIRRLAPFIETEAANRPDRGPLLVDVLSVKEHPRLQMLGYLPAETDILCTHPMFGPESGKDSWRNLKLVYEMTRINSVVLDPIAVSDSGESFVDSTGKVRWVDADNDAHVEGVDRVERFLSLFEEEGCNMVKLSCRDHDSYASDTQFISHIVGRVLGSQGLEETPIDTSGFRSVLDLIGATTSDTFDLFYGLYKYNKNSGNTIDKLKSGLDDVVGSLHAREEEVLQSQ